MAKADEKKIERLVGKLRASHDKLEGFIKSNPEALQVLEESRRGLFDLVGAYEDMIKSIYGRENLVFEELILHKAVRDAVVALEDSTMNVKGRFNKTLAEACQEFGVDLSEGAKQTTHRMYMKVLASVLEGLAVWDSEQSAK